MKTLITIIAILGIPFIILNAIIRVLGIIFIGISVAAYSRFWDIDYYGIPEPITKSAKIMAFLMNEDLLIIKHLKKLRKYGESNK
jgi:hypothetical protein